MKKIVTLVLAMSIGIISFGQKKELKAIEKALKSSNFSSAKTLVSSAEALLGNMDNKSKAKFYYLKAKALLAGGSGSDVDVDVALTSLDKLKEVETSLGKLKYTQEANEITSKMLNSFLTKASNDFTSKNYKSAAQGFERVYKMSPKDTLYLFYAASAAVSDQDYDNALNYYNQLRNMKYTGVALNHYATNVETSKEDLFNDKITRDFSVKAKTHTNPRDEKTKSKSAEIVKNIALIYVSQGQNEKALGAMADARKENPEDVGLILSEANVHLEMGNRDKFKSLVSIALEKDPENTDLIYNLGVISAESGNIEEAKGYYQKVLQLDPNYTNAYTNMAFVVLDKEQSIIEQMNSLGNSAADNRKYDELKSTREGLYREAIPYLEKALELENTNINAAKTLKSIYSSLGDTAKYKEFKAKVEAIESNSDE